jgi:hypothetical protein
MAELGTGANPIVSIQRVGAADPVQGHLAWGTLVGNDLIVVARGIDWIDQSESAEILLVSARSDGRGFVERAKPSSIHVLGVQTDRSGAVALVRLAHPAQHKAVLQLAETATFHRLFEQELVGSLDVGAALEAAGAVPRELASLPVQEVLGPVTDWEVKPIPTRVNVGLPPDSVFTIWCSFTRTCDEPEGPQVDFTDDDPTSPPPGPWWV